MPNIQIFFLQIIQSSQTGGQLYNDTSPYEVSECYLLEDFSFVKSASLILLKFEITSCRYFS